MFWLAIISTPIAVWLAFPSGAGQLRRLSRYSDRLPQWLVGRPDSIGFTTRLLIGLLASSLGLVLLPWPIVLGSVLLGAGITIGLGRLESPAHRRDQELLAIQQPTVLDLLVASLESGVPLRSAVTEVAALSPVQTAGFLNQILARIAVGIPEAEAWKLASKNPVWQQIGQDISSSVANGTALAQILENHAEEARINAKNLRAMAAKRVGVKVALPLISCFLPAFLAVGVIPIIGSLIGGQLGW